MRRPLSKDPHRRQRNFLLSFFLKMSKFVLGFRNFGYEFSAVGEMFEGDSADTCGGKFPLMLIGVEQRV